MNYGARAAMPQCTTVPCICGLALAICMALIFFRMPQTKPKKLLFVSKCQCARIAFCQPFILGSCHSSMVTKARRSFWSHVFFKMSH